jgi:hypothetical protein
MYNSLHFFEFLFVNIICLFFQCYCHIKKTKRKAQTGYMLKQF